MHIFTGPAQNSSVYLELQNCPNYSPRAKTALESFWRMTLCLINQCFNCEWSQDTLFSGLLLSSACSEQTSKYSLADFWPFFPLSRLLFPVLPWKLVRNEDQHLDDLSSVYLDSTWLTWDGETLAPFQGLPKRLSPQTPGIVLLQFSPCILRKNYSRADELVHTILLVIFDPTAITPAVVHGILTKISFPFILHKTSLNLQHWELLLAVTAQVVWILIKLFFCLEQNGDSMATRNAQRQ